MLTTYMSRHTIRVGHGIATFDLRQWADQNLVKTAEFVLLRVAPGYLVYEVLTHCREDAARIYLFFGFDCCDRMVVRRGERLIAVYSPPQV